LELEKDVSKLQEKLQAKKDLKAALKMQDEKWLLAMDEKIKEIEHNSTWTWSDNI